MAESVDAVVVGAGVIGLACARALATSGREVLVLDRNGRIGEETSSRNSEVIHAGIYYSPGTAKAALCVEGKGLLYEYCRDFQIPHKRCGKLIVAVEPDQVDALENYRAQATRNGAGDLTWLSGSDVQRLEPAVNGVAGVFSESTGIIDSHAYMESLLGEVQRHGGALALQTEVSGISRSEAGRLLVRTEQIDLAANTVVNAAGLWAPQLASAITLEQAEPVPEPYYAKGHYYALTGRSPFQHLVYPVAEPGGLGVHVTLDMAGAARFGPDVRWCADVDYTFDDSHRAEFVRAIRRYYPDLDESQLQPGYTGIRPKIVPAGSAAGDFRIRGPADHGVEGLVHLFGIESPGLTASLAIADRVADLANNPSQRRRQGPR